MCVQERPDILLLWCRGNTEHGILRTHTKRIHETINALCNRRLSLLRGGSLDETIGSQLNTHLVEEGALRERPVWSD